LIEDLRGFLARLQTLREELRTLISTQGKGRREIPKDAPAFARELSLLGRQRKNHILEEANREPDPYRTITGILDALTGGASP
jgi:hypothetical protein